MNPNPFSALNHLTVPVGMGWPPLGRSRISVHGTRGHVIAADRPDSSLVCLRAHQLDRQPAFRWQRRAPLSVLREDHQVTDPHRRNLVDVADPPTRWPAGLDGLRLVRVPLAPEIRLHLATDPIVLWARMESEAG